MTTMLNVTVSDEELSSLREHHAKLCEVIEKHDEWYQRYKHEPVPTAAEREYIARFDQMTQACRVIGRLLDGAIS